MKKHWLLLPLAASTSFMPLASCNSQQHYDYENLINSYRKMLLETINTNLYDEKSAQWIIENELISTPITIESKTYDSYCFKPEIINYEDPNPSLWPAHQHIVRALAIAVLAYKNEDTNLMDIANKLTIYWLGHNYVNENWWFNMIGVPRDFSNLAIFVINNLAEELKPKVFDWIHHGSLMYNEQTLDQTGTNMFWVGDITLKSGLLEHDDKEINLMFEKVSGEIQLDKDEGFQSDGSYFQHGNQLYTGGYGRQGALLLAKIASAFVDSDVRLSQDKLKIVVDFALDGMKYFTHKKNFNWQCMGRTYTRKQAAQYDGGTTDLGNIDELRYFAQLPNCPRKDELKELLNHWKNGEPTFEGVKYFEKSRFLASCIDGIYIGFKGTNSNLINCEIANNENRLAHNLTYGVNVSIMETGDEYTDISPIWNYWQIPGTSAYEEEDEILNSYENEDFKQTKTGAFYGGFNKEEQVGCVAQYSWHELKDTSTTFYRIAGFATPWGLVVVGNTIFNSTREPLTTTIQQCIQADGITPTISPDYKTVTHGNVVYSNIEDGDEPKLKLITESTPRQFPWSRNNGSYSETDLRSAKVLTIQIDNSEKPKNKTSYAYAIQPKTQVDKSKTFKVVTNNQNAQSILLPDGKIAVIFYKNNTSFEYEGIKCEGNKGEFKIFGKN